MNGPEERWAAQKEADEEKRRGFGLGNEMIDDEKEYPWTKDDSLEVKAEADNDEEKDM